MNRTKLTDRIRPLYGESWISKGWHGRWLVAMAEARRYDRRLGVLAEVRLPSLRPLTWGLAYETALRHLIDCYADAHVGIVNWRESSLAAIAHDVMRGPTEGSIQPQLDVDGTVDVAPSLFHVDHGTALVKLLTRNDGRPVLQVMGRCYADAGKAERDAGLIVQLVSSFANKVGFSIGVWAEGGQ